MARLAGQKAQGVEEGIFEGPGVADPCPQNGKNLCKKHRESRYVQGIQGIRLRGNVADRAVGIVIGAAFGTIVKSFVDDVLMRPSACSWVMWIFPIFSLP